MQTLLLALILSPLSPCAELEFTLSSSLPLRTKQIAFDSITLEEQPVILTGKSIPAGTKLQFDQGYPIFNSFSPTEIKGVRAPVRHKAGLFPLRITFLPRSFRISVEERNKLLETTIYASLREISEGIPVRKLYAEKIPAGSARIPFRFTWDWYNPTGLWSLTVQESLRAFENRHLVDNAPADVVDFCPNFFSLDLTKKEFFWIALLSEIAGLESSYNPLTAADEGRFNANSAGITSSGLTQISLDSTRQECYQARGCTAVKTQGDLFNPTRELRCSVAVMSCLVERGACISCQNPEDQKWKGMAAYWSTLRSPYTVDCPTCTNQKITVGKKAQVVREMSEAAPFCFGKKK